ncbi:hypothetical protein GOP47_0024142 [Adiantum capillus-veneris]|uniref:Uncharacterized protein n=1 Tax=Adiantum capillus-veneris TaxID=13818 RepID=A0A9D4U5A0_ADICA|nr:hypothetical protein GOP47_0024142 [Adiantum capillus-veneris]
MKLEACSDEQSKEKVAPLIVLAWRGWPSLAWERPGLQARWVAIALHGRASDGNRELHGERKGWHAEHWRRKSRSPASTSGVEVAVTKGSPGPPRAKKRGRAAWGATSKIEQGQETVARGRGVRHRRGSSPLDRGTGDAMLGMATRLEKVSAAEEQPVVIMGGLPKSKKQVSSTQPGMGGQ